MKLNDNYRIVYDSENTILQFFEQRESFKKDDKLKQFGEMKEFVDNYYCPNLKTALTIFLSKCTWGMETPKEILSELNRLESLIKQIK